MGNTNALPSSVAEHFAVCRDIANEPTAYHHNMNTDDNLQLKNNGHTTEGNQPEPRLEIPPLELIPPATGQRQSEIHKRPTYPFVPHKKTPYLARRGKPNPNCKKDGSPGDPVPFGPWYVYKTIDGVFHRFSLKTEVYEEAKRKYDVWLSNLDKVQTVEGSLSTLVPAIIKRREATRSSKQSMVPVRNAANRLIRGCPFMKVPYRELTNGMVFEQWNEFVNTGCLLQDDGTKTYHDYSLNTLREDLLMLRSVVKLAVKKHCIPADNDLLEEVTLEDPDNSCPRCVRELNQEIFQKIRWHMYNGNGNRHPHTPIVFDVYWMSGGRKSSVAAIQTEDVNFGTGWLFFRVAKGRPEGYSVPMSIDLQLLLKEHIEKFDKKPGEKIFDVCRINSSIATACEAAGWQHMHAHDFRHLFACNALERTKNIALVAKWLGHTDGGILAAQVYATTRDEESKRNMNENMIFISREWSPAGLGLMKTKLQSQLNNLSAQIGVSATQSAVEKILHGLKELVENPLAATATDAHQVLAKGSVIPLGAKHVVLNRMVDWISQNPAIRTYLVMDILKAKFPESTEPIRARALVLTRQVRRAAVKAADKELHNRLVTYLRDHPDRYITWALYDFPEATICQVHQAILAGRGQFKAKMAAARDHSCPATMNELLTNRKEKQMEATINKLMATNLPT